MQNNLQRITGLLTLSAKAEALALVAVLIGVWVSGFWASLMATMVLLGMIVRRLL